jgi:hypothetical protein
MLGIELLRSIPTHKRVAIGASILLLGLIMCYLIIQFEFIGRNVTTNTLKRTIELDPHFDYFKSIRLFSRPSWLRMTLGIQGSIREKSGLAFGFYITNQSNFVMSQEGKPPTIYLSGSGNASYVFSLVLTPEHVPETLYLVVVPGLVFQPREAQAGDPWFYDFIYPWFDDWITYDSVLPLFSKYRSNVTYTCHAHEAGGSPFDIIVVGETDFERYKKKMPLQQPYFIGKGVSSYNFSFTVPANQSGGDIYFIEKRPDNASESRGLFGKPTLRVLLICNKTWLEPVKPAIKVDILVNVTSSEPDPLYELFSASLMFIGAVTILGPNGIAFVTTLVGSLIDAIFSSVSETSSESMDLEWIQSELNSCLDKCKDNYNDCIDGCFDDLLSYSERRRCFENCKAKFDVCRDKCKMEYEVNIIQYLQEDYDQDEENDEDDEDE